MKHLFIPVCLFYAWSAAGQTNSLNPTGNIGIGITNPLSHRLNIHTADTTVSNMIRMLHDGIPNSTMHIGTASSTYLVTNHRSANLLESYRDLRIGAANAGNIYFETGRTFTFAPVRMMINNSGNVGIGTESPLGKFHVNGNAGNHLASFTYNDLPSSGAFIRVTNGTSAPGLFYPAIVARSLAPGRAFGFGLVGEVEDVLPSGDASFGAITLQGRSKNLTPLSTNNVLTVNNYATNLLVVKANGSVGIGTTAPGAYKLAVEGTIGARKVKVTQSAWADFVFDEGYQLPEIDEVSAFISRHKHLPGIPTAGEVEKDGLDLGDMHVKLLQKIEELTLYLIEDNRRIKAQQEMIETLQTEMRTLKEKLK